MKKYLFILLATMLCGISPGADCPLFGWLSIAQKADVKFVEKLRERINSLRANGQAINTSPRYANVNVDEKPIWAHQDTYRSFCEAGAVTGNKVGSEAADSFVDTLTHPKVVHAIDVPYDKIGRCLGQVSKHIDDGKCKKMLDGWRSNLDNNTQTNNLFTEKGYNSAHALRDCDDVFGLNLPNSNHLADGLGRQGDWGFTYQLNATASIHKRGEKLVALDVDVDTNSPFYDLKGVDALTETAAYNIKSSRNALSDSFLKPLDREKIINSITAAKNKSPSLKYVIATPEAPDFNAPNMVAFKADFESAGYSDAEFTDLFEIIEIRS